MYSCAGSAARSNPVDGDGAHVIKTRGIQSVPARVAVEVALELLRCALWISKPHRRIACGALGHCSRKRLHFALPHDKRKQEADLDNRLNVVMNGENGEARKLRHEAFRRVQNEDLLLILEVEFLKNSGMASHDIPHAKIIRKP